MNGFDRKTRVALTSSDQLREQGIERNWLTLVHDGQTKTLRLLIADKLAHLESV